jgi:hypothetical protein
VDFPDLVAPRGEKEAEQELRRAVHQALDLQRVESLPSPV